MRCFRVALYGRPPGAEPGAIVSLEGVELATLRFTGPPDPLPVTFEEAEAALVRFPRLYFEPDGSFGWFSAPDEPRWEVGGMLYDRGDRIAYAEVNGTCSPAAFRDLVEAFGHRRALLIVQLLTPAVFLDPDEFCRVL